MAAAAGRVRAKAALIRFAAHQRIAGGRAPHPPDTGDPLRFLNSAMEWVQNIPDDDLLASAADVSRCAIHIHDYLGVDLVFFLRRKAGGLSSLRSAGCVPAVAVRLAHQLQNRGGDLLLIGPSPKMTRPQPELEPVERAAPVGRGWVARPPEPSGAEAP
jgi:hypothetical protein